MATYTIGEAMSRLPKLLDRVAADAEAYMKQYIHNGTKDATGALENSIKTRKISDRERGIGTSLKSASSGEVYGKYVNDGRGPVTAKHLTKKGGKGYLRFEIPRGGEVFYRRSVKAAKGIHFIEKTKEHLERTHYSL